MKLCYEAKWVSKKKTTNREIEDRSWWGNLEESQRDEEQSRLLHCALARSVTKAISCSNHPAPRRPNNTCSLAKYPCFATSNSNDNFQHGFWKAAIFFSKYIYDSRVAYTLLTHVWNRDKTFHRYRCSRLPVKSAQNTSIAIPKIRSSRLTHSLTTI